MSGHKCCIPKPLYAVLALLRIAEHDTEQDCTVDETGSVECKQAVVDIVLMPAIVIESEQNAVGCKIPEEVEVIDLLLEMVDIGADTQKMLHFEIQSYSGQAIEELERQGLSKTSPPAQPFQSSEAPYSDIYYYCSDQRKPRRLHYRNLIVDEDCGFDYWYLVRLLVHIAPAGRSRIAAGHSSGKTSS
jgi:hypothetical protein